MPVMTTFIHSSLWPALQLTVCWWIAMSTYRNTSGAMYQYSKMQYCCSSTLFSDENKHC